jgi:hypothetical protein
MADFPWEVILKKTVITTISLFLGKLYILIQIDSWLIKSFI